MSSEAMQKIEQLNEQQTYDLIVLRASGLKATSSEA